MQSATKRNKFERMGQFVQICFNEQMTQIDEEDIFYNYDTTKVKIFSKRNEVIQSIVRIRYKDMDSEFAARINGGQELTDHNEWREQSKLIATEFEEYISTLFS